MLLDANLLLYAVDEESARHERARDWLEQTLSGDRRVGFPWQTLSAFIRIATHPRAMRSPLSSIEAWQYVEDWLAAPTAWIPQPGHGYRQILRRLVCELDLRGNLVSDAMLAALCIEHGVPIASADSDFARFREITWINPVDA
jgi:toxin-antitoxin system PIN domain toxin